MQRLPTITAFARSAALATLLALAAAPAMAGRSDALIEGGKLCTQQFPVQEREQHIPTHLLAAISTTESGRWHKGLGMAVPWPWTINVDGKGYYFDTKAEAIAQVQRLMAQGKRSIDVGCMQVNLKHHAGAFPDLNQAFEPQANVAYAARFLRTNYNDLGDWIKATAAYHSRTEARGKQYLGQIERSWNRIVAKVAEARANQSGKGGVVEAQAAAPAAATPAVVKPDPLRVASAAPEIALGNRAAMRPLASTRNVKVISVSEPVRKSDVLVVNGPTAAPAATQLAAPVATPAPAAGAETAAAATGDMLIRPAASSVRRVALDNPAAPAQPNGTQTPAKSVFVN